MVQLVGFESMKKMSLAGVVVGVPEGSMPAWLQTVARGVLTAEAPE